MFYRFVNKSPSVPVRQIYKLIDTFKNQLQNLKDRKVRQGKQDTNYILLADRQQDLHKALLLYIQAVNTSDRIHQAVRGFARTVHKIGYSDLGIDLLKFSSRIFDATCKYNKITHIVQEQKNQRYPFNKILLDLHQFLDFEDIDTLTQNLFGSSPFIQQVKFYDSLSLQQQSRQITRYMVIYFEDFVKANKTMQLLDKSVYFGIDIYWLNQFMEVSCIYKNGQQEFSKGIFICDRQIQYLNCRLNDEELQIFNKKFPNNYYKSMIHRCQLLQILNSLNIYMLQEYQSQFCRKKNQWKKIF